MLTEEELRDEIIALIKQNYTASAAEYDGCNCSAAEIAIADKKGKPVVFRVTVVAVKE
ncbi:MAG: hypothetical protein FWE62_01755 [Firmicutes bacterium]|nr:hypothetical protein [Bacillota bacterium]